jgi:hypothetical protein
MVNDDPDPSTPVLSYARPGAGLIPRTSIVVEELSEGVRFIDPPTGRRRPGQRAVVGAAALAGRATLVIFACGVGFRLTATHAGLLAAAAGLAALWFSYRRLMQAASSPTVVTVLGGKLYLRWPAGRQVAIRVADVTAVRARTPRRWVVVPGRYSALRVSTRRRTYGLLDGHDYPEVRWLAGRIRGVLGLPEPSRPEVPVNPRLDVQEPVPLGAAAMRPWPALDPRAVHEDVAAPVSRWLSKQYENFGCLTLLFVVAFGLIGAWICRRWAERLAISAAFGSSAYVVDHVRLLPHRSPWLTNGRQLPAWYHALFDGLSCTGFFVSLAVGFAVGIPLARLERAWSAWRFRRYLRRHRPDLYGVR